MCLGRQKAFQVDETGQLNVQSEEKVENLWERVSGPNQKIKGTDRQVDQCAWDTCHATSALPDCSNPTQGSAMACVSAFREEELDPLAPMDERIQSLFRQRGRPVRHY